MKPKTNGDPYFHVSILYHTVVEALARDLTDRL